MKFERKYFGDIVNHNGSLFLLDRFISDKLPHYKIKRNFDLGSYKKNYVSALSPALSRRILTEKKIITIDIRISSFFRKKIIRLIFEIINEIVFCDICVSLLSRTRSFIKQVSF